jgi:DNA-binding winged helix-turn-helix (wHTH) protein
LWEFYGFLREEQPLRLRFGECLFDSETRELTRSGAPVHVSPKGFRLLEILLERRPRAVSRRQLHRLLWPDTFVADATLNSLVAEVRAAIGDESRSARLIRTVPVFGYAFSGEAKSEAGKAGSAGPACRVLWAGRRYDLAPGDNVLGRGPEAAVSLEDDERVSRRHALLHVETDGSATLEDLKSKNGTFLRGKPLKGSAKLEDGDEFVLGDTALQFRCIRGTVSTRSTRGRARAAARPD